MHRLFRFAGLMILSAMFAVPAITAAQDKKANDAQKETKKQSDKTKPKPDWAVELIGKLTVVEDKDDQLIFTVQINYKVPELNTDAQRQIAQHQQTLAQQQLQLARAKTIQDRQNILNQMANTSRQIEQSQAQLWKFKDVNLDVKCQAAEKMRVRKYEPIQQIDSDTGEFIKWTKELLEQARGHEGYPGYKAEAKILRTGQVVKVYLWKDSKTPASVLEKGKADKKIDDIQDELKNFRYDVIMIYVAADAPKKS